MKHRRLTCRQASFVEQFALDHNGAAAAVRAGFAPGSARVTASRLLSKANVREAVAVLEADAAKALNITREGVLQTLQDAYDRARLLGEPAVMVAAARAVAAICGFVPGRKTAPAKASPKARAMMAEVEAMSDAELLEILCSAKGTPG